MTFVVYARELMSIDRVRERAVEKRSTPFRKLCELACGMALFHAGFGRLPDDLVVGIVGVSDYGDRYPELCRQANGKLRPHQFSSSVLNSGIGHCALVFGLTGPQVQMTRPASIESAHAVARMLLSKRRADLMLIVDYADDEQIASASLMGVAQW